MLSGLDCWLPLVYLLYNVLHSFPSPPSFSFHFSFATFFPSVSHWCTAHWLSVGLLFLFSLCCHADSPFPQSPPLFQFLLFFQQKDSPGAISLPLQFLSFLLTFLSLAYRPSSVRMISCCWCKKWKGTLNPLPTFLHTYSRDFCNHMCRNTPSGESDGLLCDNTLTPVFAHTEMNNSRRAAESERGTAAHYRLSTALSWEQVRETQVEMRVKQSERRAREEEMVWREAGDDGWEGTRLCDGFQTGLLREFSVTSFEGMSNPPIWAPNALSDPSLRLPSARGKHPGHRRLLSACARLLRSSDFIPKVLARLQHSVCVCLLESGLSLVKLAVLNPQLIWGDQTIL